VAAEIVPVLETQYAGLFVLHEWDLGVESNYLTLASTMERLGVRENAHVFMVLDGTNMMAGFDVIAEELFARIDHRLAAPPAEEPEPAARLDPAPDRGVLKRRFDRFTLAGVIVAGLLDGINPCAISTLVFLISVLSMSSVRGRDLLVVGAAFCLASFATYTAIGFGLLHAVHALYYFDRARRVFDVVMVLVLLAFAFYSFRDAWRFSRTGSARDVTLQLPDGIKRRIHRVVRVGLKQSTQATWAFAIGALVTVLESVCTGQVYVPTLAFLVKSGSEVGRGLGYLLVYNLMFVTPLVVVFLLTYQGLKLKALMQWSTRNVVISKALLGCFFLALAAAIALIS
jgi:cytochrome c biogenesis protein CcdA